MDKTTLETKWQEVINNLRDDLSDSAIQNWISKPITPVKFNDGELVLNIDGKFYKDKIESKYIGLLRSACNAAFEDKVLISFKVEEQAYNFGETPDHVAPAKQEAKASSGVNSTNMIHILHDGTF